MTPEERLLPIFERAEATLVGCGHTHMQFDRLIGGVVSYLVSRRRGEIGIRIALGAQGQTITGLVLRHALWPALAGVAAGLVASIALTEGGAQSAVRGRAQGSLVLVGVSVLLLLVAAVASLVPARRAARVDPIEVLRTE